MSLETGMSPREGVHHVCAGLFVELIVIACFSIGMIWMAVVDGSAFSPLSVLILGNILVLSIAFNLSVALVFSLFEFVWLRGRMRTALWWGPALIPAGVWAGLITVPSLCVLVQKWVGAEHMLPSFVRFIVILFEWGFPALGIPVILIVGWWARIRIFSAIDWPHR